MCNKSNNLCEKEKRKWIKNERGSVSLYAMVSVLIILTILLSTYIYNSHRHEQSLDVTRQIKMSYEQGIDNVDQIYNGLVTNNPPKFKLVKTQKSNNTCEFRLTDMLVYNGAESDGTVSVKPHNSSSWTSKGNSLTFDIEGPGLFDIKYTDKLGFSYTVTDYVYVGENLLYRIDGEDNTRNGHNDTTTTWEDLSLNRNDANLSGGTTNWGDKYYNFANGSTQFFTTVNNMALGSSARTVEFVMSVGNTSTQNFFGVGVNGNYQIMDSILVSSGFNCHVYGTSANEGINSVAVVNQIYSNTWRYSSSKMSYRTNDATSNNVSFYALNTSSSPFYIGQGVYTPHNNNYPFKIYSIRIYSTQLTDAQVNANYEIDKYRFGIVPNTDPAPIAPPTITFAHKVDGGAHDTNIWTQKNITVEASIPSGTGYSIQTSKNGVDWVDSAIQVFETNGVMYARLKNAQGGILSETAVVEHVSNIDKEPPTIASVTVNDNERHFNSFSIRATDEGSKINAYAVTKTDSKPTSTEWIPTVSLNLNDVQTKNEYGAAWARIFYHYNNYGKVLFSKSSDWSEAKSTNGPDKFSILGNINDSWKNTSGQFEFLLQYPTELPNQYNRWLQTANPSTTTEVSGQKAPGYEAVGTPSWTGNSWGGLLRSSYAGSSDTTGTFIDGSVGHGNWYYAIGSAEKWGGGIPSGSVGVKADVTLWARIDNLAQEAKTEINVKVGSIDTNGTYYVWVKDSMGNVAKQAVVNNGGAPARRNAFLTYGTQVKMQYNASWALLLYHHNQAGTVLFENDEQVLSCNDTNRFSILGRLDDSFKIDGKFEFLLQYPVDYPTQYNRWRQSGNPINTTVADGDGSANAPGYEEVEVSWKSNYWGGLTRSTTPANTYLDGSVGHGYWWYAVGSKQPHGGGIPGYTVTKNITELWVRVH